MNNQGSLAVDLGDVSIQCDSNMSPPISKPSQIYMPRTSLKRLATAQCVQMTVAMNHMTVGEEGLGLGRGQEKVREKAPFKAKTSENQKGWRKGVDGQPQTNCRGNPSGYACSEVGLRATALTFF